MVEHFSPGEMEQFLAKCARVLRPGGILRLAVPDLEAEVEGYRASRAAGRTDAADELNRLFYNAPGTDGANLVHRLAITVLHRPHSWMYDFDSMATRMQDAGFTDVTRFAYREGRLPEVDVLDVRPESLFVEALRP
jgi:SAM-dependent methyltransferase